VQAALSFARSHAKEYGISPSLFENHDIHLHVPEGAIPKDGPSAGVTMATALISALSNSKVRHDVAMTGEITLRGKILPVGGLKEKMLAAHRAGITTIIAPARNKKDMVDIPKKVQRELTIIFADKMDDVLKTSLIITESAAKKKRSKSAAKKPAKNATDNAPAV
jgi:ATP-dependent Lon protease